MTIQDQLNKLDTEYWTKRNKLFKRMTNGWRYCRYQGCNACIQHNGLVPKSHAFAGKYGPKDRFND